MQRVERIVVHIEHGLALSDQPDEASQRLALLLLDSAAELLMHRQCEYELWWERSDHQHLESLREQERRKGLPPELHDEKRRLEAKVTSNTARRKISREFDAKAAFLRDRGHLETGVQRALQRLHHYRNEAHHRDEVREETLSTAVRIYSYLVCLLLRDLPLHAVVMGYDSPMPVALSKYFSGVAPPPTDVQAAIAELLLKRVLHGHEAWAQIPPLLSGHLVERIEELDDSLGYIADYVDDLRHEGWDKEAVLRWLQIEDTYTAAFAKPKTAMLEGGPIGLADLKDWQRQAQVLAAERDLLVAFSSFSDLEDALEPVERPALEAVRGIDDAVHLELKAMRGG